MSDFDNQITPQEQFLRDNPHAFEQYILVALDANQDLWTKISRHLCRTKKGLPVNDFSSLPPYAIYRAIASWRELVAANEFSPISERGLLSSLYNLYQATPPLITMEQVTEFAREFLKWRSTIYADEAVAIVKPIWRKWLTNSKTASILTDARRAGMSDVDATVDKIATLNSEIQKDTEEDPDLWTVDMIFDKEDAVTERIPLSNDFRNINACLGGGLGKGEHVIFVSASGGGKTVLACQLAADLAIAGRGVVLITTEQPPWQLLMRIVSNISIKMGVPIPMSLLKDGFTSEIRDSLSDTQLKAIQEIKDQVSKYLTFGDWSKGLKTMADVPKFIEKTKKHYEELGITLDCVILDWIGGSLSEKTTDTGKLRLLLMQAATTMKLLAVEQNVATVSTAQASDDASGKAMITEHHFADCKGMHREATAGFGISAVKLRNVDDSMDVQEAYEERQHIYCFKARKSKGKFWAVKRNFGYQRFEGL